ncbi:hypothetical protein PMKS-000195 [Pichia membranifaciens]|uniref:Nucleolar protein Dnt1-like N-terminal domain-containing protein n=1 Tax=Pichia membranifaciens TaxID=4926 RepID=A0A1Q2YB26_9ASCO|nr:hypothetical protein PMKS-000195 [Pichia membranifaciens]
MFKLQVLIIPQSALSTVESSSCGTANTASDNAGDANDIDGNNLNNSKSNNGGKNSIFRTYSSSPVPGSERALNAISTPIPASQFNLHRLQSYNPNSSFAAYPNSFVSLPSHQTQNIRTKKFLHITYSSNRLETIAQEISQRFLKLYPNEEPLHILHIQDYEECDLDPDYTAEMVFDNNNICRVIVANEFNESDDAIINSNGKRYLAGDLNSVMKKVRKPKTLKHSIESTSLANTSIWSFDEESRFSKPHRSSASRSSHPYHAMNKPIGMKEDANASHMGPNISLAIPEVDDTVIHPHKSEHLKIASPIVATGSPTRITSGMLNAKSQPDLSKVDYEDLNSSMYVEPEEKRASVSTKEDAMRNRLIKTPASAPVSEAIADSSLINNADLSSSSLNVLPENVAMELKTPESNKTSLLSMTNKRSSVSGSATKKTNKKQKTQPASNTSSPSTNAHKSLAHLDQPKSGNQENGPKLAPSNETSTVPTPANNAAIQVHNTDGKDVEVTDKEDAAKEKATKEKAEKTEKTKAAKEKAAKEKAEKAEKAKIAKEKAAKERAEKAEKAKAAKEKAAKEKAEKAERVKAEKEKAAKEKAEKAEKAKAEKEKLAKEKAEKAKAAKEKAEKEKAEKEKAEKEKAEKEKAEKEKAEKEKAEKEKAEKEKAEKEKAEKEKAEKEKAEKEKAEKEKAAKEKAAKEKVVKEKVAKERAEKEKAEKEKAEKEKLAKKKAEEDNVAKERGEKEKLAKEKEQSTEKNSNISSHVIPENKPLKRSRRVSRNDDVIVIDGTPEVDKGARILKKSSNAVAADVDSDNILTDTEDDEDISKIRILTRNDTPEDEKLNHPAKAIKVTKLSVSAAKSRVPNVSLASDKNEVSSVGTSNNLNNNGGSTPSNVSEDSATASSEGSPANKRRDLKKKEESSPGKIISKIIMKENAKIINGAARHDEISGDIDMSNILPQKNRVVKPVATMSTNKITDKSSSETDSSSDSSSGSSSDSGSGSSSSSESSSDSESSDESSDDESSRPKIVPAPKIAMKASTSSLGKPEPPKKSTSTTNANVKSPGVLPPILPKPAPYVKPPPSAKTQSSTIVELSKRSSLPRLSAFLDKKLPEVRMQKNQSAKTENTEIKPSDSDSTGSSDDSSSSSASDSDSDSDTASDSSDSDSEDGDAVKAKFINARTANQFVSTKKSKTKAKKNKGFSALMKDSKK